MRFKNASGLINAYVERHGEEDVRHYVAMTLGEAYFKPTVSTPGLDTFWAENLNEDGRALIKNFAEKRKMRLVMPEYAEIV